jgi:hypothetical protein
MDAGAFDADENTQVQACPVRIRAVAVHTSGIVKVDLGIT